MFYVAHRLTVAGYGGSSLFSAGAIQALYAASGGTPRLVNILAHKAMMLCFGEGGHEIRARHVNIAARDTGATRRFSFVWPWAAGAVLLLVAGGLGWMWLR